MNLTLYSNRNSHHDFIRNAINTLITKAKTIKYAAFLTDTNVLENLSKHGCKVRIVVRLGFPTSPKALESLLKITNIEARFFSDNSFHPKLYIFGSSGALVGSANLTHAAMTTNQEIMVHIDAEDDIFTELVDLFSEYWEESKVLTSKLLKIIKKYTIISTLYLAMFISLRMKFTKKLEGLLVLISVGKKQNNQKRIYLLRIIGKPIRNL